MKKNILILAADYAVPNLNEMSMEECDFMLVPMNKSSLSCQVTKNAPGVDSTAIVVWYKRKHGETQFYLPTNKGPVCK